jgi:hypothetical protein
MAGLNRVDEARRDDSGRFRVVADGLWQTDDNSRIEANADGT